MTHGKMDSIPGGDPYKVVRDRSGRIISAGTKKAMRFWLEQGLLPPVAPDEAVKMWKGLLDELDEIDRALGDWLKSYDNRRGAVINLRQAQMTARENYDSLKALYTGALDLIGTLRREHKVVEGDCWFSCPKSGDNCNDDAPKDVCECGADEWNARIDEFLKGAPRL